MKKVLSNYLYQATYQILLIILPIITIPIVSNALGADGVGKYNFIYSLSNYFVLVAGLGLSSYGVREIAFVRDDRQKLSIKFWELQGFNLFFSVTAFFVYILFSLTRKADTSLYLIQGLVVLASVIDISWFYSGLEDFKKITIRNFIIKIATFTSILLLVRTRADLSKYFLIQSLGTLLGSGSLWISIQHYVNFVFVRPKQMFKHLLPALSFFSAKIAMTLYENLNQTILGIMVGMSAVGIYSNALSIIVMAASLINALNTVLIPRMSHLASSGKQDKLVDTLMTTIHMQLFLTIAISAGIVGISDKLVPWLFGSDFMQLQQVLPIAAPVLIFQSLQMSISLQYLIPTNRIKEYNVSIYVGAVFSVVVTLSLANIIGVYAAVCGIGMGYLSICLFRGLSLQANTKFRFKWVLILKYLLSGALMAVIVYLFGRYFAAGLLTSLVQVLIGAVIYLTVTTLMKVNPFWEYFVQYISKR